VESNWIRFWEHFADKELAYSECARLLTMSERLCVDVMLTQFTSLLAVVTNDRASQTKPDVLMALVTAVLAIFSRISVLPTHELALAIAMALPSLLVCE